MIPLLHVSGYAASLPRANVDTDLIIPKQYLTTITRAGLGRGLFHELRYDEGGAPRPGFVLNRAPFDKACILVSGRNFGCGSSREHAPWALLDFGIRCVIAPSFADIFFGNCFKVGLLPAKVTEEDGATLIDLLTEQQSDPILSIDIAEQVILLGDRAFPFDISKVRKDALMEGRDDIVETLAAMESIATYERAMTVAVPWAQTLPRTL